MNKLIYNKYGNELCDIINKRWVCINKNNADHGGIRVQHAYENNEQYFERFCVGNDVIIVTDNKLIRAIFK